MDPRKKSRSPRKSTSLPKEFLDNVKDVFTKTFKKQLKGRAIIVEGRIYPDEVLLSVGYKESPKALRQTNFEASVDSNGKDVLKKLELCVDGISSMMSQYFEADEDLDLPRNWKAFPFEKDTIFLQYSGRNTELEAEANKILGLKRGDELMIDEAEDLEDVDEGEEEPGDGDNGDERH
ncbi:MAG TPA: hypothetical protein VFV50_10840 [Bdellovibrionales bacterium]|nr:hypothetical protein [Bdellovibrionales bacterium]